MYTLTPFTAVRGILSVTNPVNLLQDLTNIFLAKPLGAKSLAQRMILEGASQVSFDLKLYYQYLFSFGYFRMVNLMKLLKMQQELL